MLSQGCRGAARARSRSTPFTPRTSSGISRGCHRSSVSSLSPMIARMWTRLSSKRAGGRRAPLRSHGRLLEFSVPNRVCNPTGEVDPSEPVVDEGVDGDGDRQQQHGRVLAKDVDAVRVARRTTSERSWRSCHPCIRSRPRGRRSCRAPSSPDRFRFTWQWHVWPRLPSATSRRDGRTPQCAEWSCWFPGANQSDAPSTHPVGAIRSTATHEESV